MFVICGSFQYKVRELPFEKKNPKTVLTNLNVTNTKCLCLFTASYQCVHRNDVFVDSIAYVSYDGIV